MKGNLYTNQVQPKTKSVERFPIDRFIRLSMFAKQLFTDPKATQQASQIMQGIMEAGSPRLNDIATHKPGQADASYKRIQRFLRDQDPFEALKLLFNEEADFVIRNPTEIGRPHANRTKHVGTLMDGQNKGCSLAGSGLGQTHNVAPI
jgi:hypothetical protein